MSAPQEDADPAASERAPRRGRRPLLRRRSGTSLRRAIVLFAATGLVALFAVGASAYLISGKVARDQALRDAETVAQRIAVDVVEPLLSPVLAGKTDNRRGLDAVVEAGAHSGSLNAVLVWRADGTIVYSSEPALENQRLPGSPELTAALGGRVVSAVDPGSEGPGVALDGGPHLGVYAPLRMTGRSEQYALEAYFDTSMIDQEASLLRARILPLAIGALVVLQAAQIPIAVSLARRLNRHEAERTELLEHHLALSDRERREIAADIHDGPVQDLAGVSYALSAILPGVLEDQSVRANRLREAVRRAIASLRHLMVDIYPDLSGAGLTTAVEQLADPLRDRGATVLVEQDELPELSPRAAAVLYRAAKEALANVDRHAGARTVLVLLERAQIDGRPAVRLTISDDGVGFPTSRVRERRSAPRGRNFGLQILRERVIQSGGTVGFRNGPDGGAVVDVLLPAGDPD